jgi:hypothetical protein
MALQSGFWSKSGIDTLPNIHTNPVHLGLGATAIVEHEFTGPDWYGDYSARHANDGAEGRLVSLHSFSESWDSWEMHPLGSEVVLCLSGEVTLIQEWPSGRTERITLGPNDYAINDPSVWHTADVEEEATALFITAGLGTQHRVR